jgi:carbonic anhydrase
LSIIVELYIVRVTMHEIKKLIDGFQRFRAQHYERDGAPFRRLVSKGQSPRIMVIACCDSRVDPAIITDCDPGDLFVVRNVANLVPPFEEGGGYHGTSAAIEFAVRCLYVEHVIVMGHAHCGGIRALLGDIRFEDGTGQFITPWMSIVDEARREVLAVPGAEDVDSRAAACEKRAVCVSLDNLMSFPFVREAVTAGRLQLHGWYFDLDRGELHGYDPVSGVFALLAEIAAEDSAQRV